MMSGDNFSDGSRTTRPALGDVTNLPVKRGFSSISGDGCVKKLDVETGYSGEFAKKVCLQVENMVKEKCQTIKNSMLNEKESGASSPNKRENIVSIVSIARDLGVTIAHNGVELYDTSRGGCVSSVSIPNKDCEGGERRFVSDAILPDDVHEELLVGCVSGDKDPGVGSVVSSKCGSTEWSRLPKSQGSRSFELERCVGLKGDHCANLNAGADLLKDCSCSFCLKAAYIWSDLHYQDIKGRIAEGRSLFHTENYINLALKKSQKEASFLLEKCGKGKQTDGPGQGNASNLSKLESDLMSHWKSLFLHMEDIFVQESSKLQASFLPLKDMRENCKMDLGRTIEIPSDEN
ncbi:hypothetical protein Ddye_008865 [Dipteronia dyeriana]|uniref:Uncharacterized protein n=1 Tax=Dipteronia dyeriana TaxID=168575 RepID=A0AAE0CMB6_9ROSI|nr:hypothetical protein Ddye_008865 [Dipteronia dyeriana]